MHPGTYSLKNGLGDLGGRHKSENRRMHTHAHMMPEFANKL